MSYLIMRRGPEPGKIYPLDADRISVGRGSKNQIIIHDNEVSRNHMEFVKTAAGYELHDLDSSNGTFVNGQPVDDPWPIQSQCIIELGDSITFEYRMGQPQDDPDVSEIYKSRGATPVKEKSFLVLTVEGRDEPEVYPLEGMTITVGRSTGNDIVVVEPELSREHFRLTLMPQGYFVEDLGSTNGTFVNSEPLAGQRLLYTNDVIQIGTTIRLALTNSPDSFIEHAVTSNLDGESRSDRRKTSRLPALAQSLEPTTTGTGVDHKSLENEVLITYARSDWEKIVAPMIDKLYAAEITSWVDQYLVERSNDWILATEQARLECWLLIVVISPEAMNSELVKRNWRHFQNREKSVILVVAEPVERMPIGASRLPTIQYNPAVPDIAFQQLIREINRIKEPQSDEPAQGEPEKDTSEHETKDTAAATEPAEKQTTSSSTVAGETLAQELEKPDASPETEKRAAKPLMAALEAAKNARGGSTDDGDDEASSEKEDKKMTTEHAPAVDTTAEQKSSDKNVTAESANDDADKEDTPLAKKPLAAKGDIPSSSDEKDNTSEASSQSEPEQDTNES